MTGEVHDTALAAWENEGERRMTDILDRLRDIDPVPPLSFHADLRREAADEIERLRNALQELLDAMDSSAAKMPPGPGLLFRVGHPAVDIAREALRHD